ncbi:MAG: 50S ribosomal protein L3 [Candidatus Pacearchaeota archaeon]|jgi:large subunit ribosomal protein L3
MAKISRPRRGSLQYWPRKRAKKILPSANWVAISSKNSEKVLGFIGYKVGMKSAYAKDLTLDSMTKNKKISFPVTVIECPSMKIFSVRLYKNNNVVGEFLSPTLDKDLKKRVKIPKNVSSSENTKKLDDKNYDDLRIIVYSNVRKMGLKKKPDMIEVALGGDKLEDKISFVREHLNKEIRVSDVLSRMQLVDIHGLTKGKGLQGAVKRFGIGLKGHKSEKGRRRAGSLGPWHPARVTFRAPQAGQLGMFSRISYNSKLLDVGSIKDKDINPAGGFKNFGLVRTDYIIVRGSVQGVPKRPVLLTFPLRKTKSADKKNYDSIELR